MRQKKGIYAPFWRSERNCWFVQIGKKQHRLDPDEGVAQKLYHELMAKPLAERVAPLPSASGLLIRIFDAVLDWTKTHQAEKTYTWHRDNTQNFSAGFSRTLTIAELMSIPGI